MSFLESILTAIFVMCVVFVVLTLLWLILRIIGVVFNRIDSYKKENSKQGIAANDKGIG